MKTFRRCDVRGPVTINNFRKKKVFPPKNTVKNGTAVETLSLKRKREEEECCLKDLFIAGSWEFSFFLVDGS